MIARIFTDLNPFLTDPMPCAPLAESETVDEADFVSSHAQIANKSSKALLSPVPNLKGSALTYSEDGQAIGGYYSRWEGQGWGKGVPS